MQISVLTTDREHPVVEWLINWQIEMRIANHEVEIHFDKSSLEGGDVLFLVSCSQMILEKEKSLFKQVLVLHASDLPQGRGWSPHIWSIIGGNNKITLCLLEADEPVDSGRIWLKTSIQLRGDELLDEINQKLFEAELELMNSCVNQYNFIIPYEHNQSKSSYFRKRRSSDSEIDIEKSIMSQFDLLRTVDNIRYPAFFYHKGYKYVLKIEKESDVPRTN